VTLLEQSAHLGGRARTQNEKGYSFNLGPHAFYRGGVASKTFRQWKIPFSGGLPPTASKAYFVRGDRFYPMFGDLRGLLTTRLFSIREKLEVGNLLRLFATPGSRSGSRSGETMAMWLDRHVSSPRVREFANTIVRISSFAIELDQISAVAVLAQIASALKHNVLYLDGGWQTLVEGLTERARSLGVEIRSGEPVASLGSIDATRIVLAVGPDAAGKLTGLPMPSGKPVHMASLDLALRGLPDSAPTVAFATDRPLYFSAHSASARLAPEGGKLVHVSKYLGSTQQDPKALRKELEEYATLVMPGWKQHTEFIRFLPDLTVTPMMPITPPKRERVAFAGDWVGDEGLLADAAVASALKAAA
jgi:phytoene dehydrogenase-like protein